MIIRCRSPLRISFAGGGTELNPYMEARGSLILNTTINLYAYVTLKLRNDGMVKLVSLDNNSEEDFEANKTNKFICHSRYLMIHNVIFQYFYKLFPEKFKSGIEIITHSEAPIGSGLGTSSTLTVTIIYALTNYLNLFYSKKEVALLSHHLEREVLKLQGGLQDHFSAAYGGLNFIEFKSYKDINVNQLRIDTATKCELEASIVLYYTGLSRDSGNIISSQVDAMSDGKVSFKYYDEIKASAKEAKNAIINHDIKKLGHIVHTTWQKKQKLSSKISNKTINDMYDDLIDLGIYGGKISGAGGGGFFLAIMDPLIQPKVIQYLTNRNEKNGFVFLPKLTESGCQIWKI